MRQEIVEVLVDIVGEKSLGTFALQLLDDVLNRPCDPCKEDFVYIKRLLEIHTKGLDT